MDTFIYLMIAFVVIIAIYFGGHKHILNWGMHTTTLPKVEGVCTVCAMPEWEDDYHYNCHAQGSHVDGYCPTCGFPMWSDGHTC